MTKVIYFSIGLFLAEIVAILIAMVVYRKRYE